MKARAVEPAIKAGIFSNIAVMKMIAVGLVSIILSTGQLLGTISPFMPALLCALPTRYLLTALTGGIVGTLMMASPVYKIYYIIVMCAIFGIRLIMSRLVKGRAKPLLYGCITTGIMGVLAISYSSFSQLISLNVTLMLIEAFLAGTLTYFYAIASDRLLLKRMDIPLSLTELTSIIMLGIPLITALAGISIFRVSLGVIAGVVCIYVAAIRYGVAGASVSSILVAIALNLYSLQMMEFSGMLIIASFIAGVFAPMKKLVVMTAFVATSTFALFLMGAPLILAFRVIEILFATAICVLIPSRMMQPTNQIELSKAGVAPVRGALTSKLSFASSTIKELQQDLINVSKRFKEIDANNINSVYDAASGKVCRGCTMQLKCWDDDCNETIRAFYPLGSVLRQYGKVDRTQMPTYFQDNCCKLDKLTSEVNNCYQAYSIKEGTKRHISESRSLIIDQFDSIANMLVEISDELSDVSGYDEEAAIAAAKAFTHLHCEPSQVVASLDRFGKSTIEIFVDRRIAANKLAVCEAISNATERDFDLPSISTVDGKTRITLTEKATFCIEFAAKQQNGGNDEISGDCYEYFIEKGFAYCILSDGMGCGRRAAIDSVMTCSILTKLIRAGFSMESALRLINSSLLVKSADESLATLDVAVIDLFSGETTLYKAGAASSYVCNGGRTVRLDTSSLPMGIIREVELEKTHLLLKARDMLLMISDGVIGDDGDWLMPVLSECSHMSAGDICERVLFEAHRQSTEKHEDDMTVLCCKLKKGV